MLCLAVAHLCSLQWVGHCFFLPPMYTYWHLAHSTSQIFSFWWKQLLTFFCSLLGSSTFSGFCVNTWLWRVRSAVAPFTGERHPQCALHLLQQITWSCLMLQLMPNLSYFPWASCTCSDSWVYLRSCLCSCLYCNGNLFCCCCLMDWLFFVQLLSGKQNGCLSWYLKK